MEGAYGHAEATQQFLLVLAPCATQLLNLIDSFWGKFPASPGGGAAIRHCYGSANLARQTQSNGQPSRWFLCRKSDVGAQKARRSGPKLASYAGLARAERASPPTQRQPGTVGCTAQGRRSHKKAPPGAGQAASVRARVRSPGQFQTGSYRRRLARQSSVSQKILVDFRARDLARKSPAVSEGRGQSAKEGMPINGNPTINGSWVVAFTQPNPASRHATAAAHPQAALPPATATPHRSATPPQSAAAPVAAARDGLRVLHDPPSIIAAPAMGASRVGIFPGKLQ